MINILSFPKIWNNCDKLSTQLVVLVVWEYQNVRLQWLKTNTSNFLMSFNMFEFVGWTLRPERRAVCSRRSHCLGVDPIVDYVLRARRGLVCDGLLGKLRKKVQSQWTSRCNHCQLNIFCSKEYEFNIDLRIIFKHNRNKLFKCSEQKTKVPKNHKSCTIRYEYDPRSLYSRSGTLSC